MRRLLVQDDGGSRHIAGFDGHRRRSRDQARRVIAEQPRRALALASLLVPRAAIVGGRLIVRVCVMGAQAAGVTIRSGLLPADARHRGADGSGQQDGEHRGERLRHSCDSVRKSSRRQINRPLS